MTNAATIYQETKALSPSERLELIERLIADLHAPDSECAKEWAHESQRRWDAYRRGELKTVPYDTVMGKYRRR